MSARFVLVVPAGEAEFPVVVDPLASSPGVSSCDWMGGRYYSDANFGLQGQSCKYRCGGQRQKQGKGISSQQQQEFYIRQGPALGVDTSHGE